MSIFTQAAQKNPRNVLLLKEMDLKTLQKAIFYLILLLLPCNLAKHFVFPFSSVSGILVDYLIPTVYVTDLLIIALLILWLIERLNARGACSIFAVCAFTASRLKVYGQSLFFRGRFADKKIAIGDLSACRKFMFYLRKNFFLVIFLIACILSLLSAVNFWAGFYKLAKIVEFSLFAIYIKNYINIKKDINKICQVLSFSVLWQSILAISQWFNQGSIFDYWFFGEQPFNSTTIAIKKISFFGQLKVVPLGTFTHPNVLAGFLVISMLIILSSVNHLAISHLAILFFGTIALFLTFSFPSWVVFILSLGLLVVKKFGKIGLISLIGLIGLMVCLIPADFWEPTSFVRRKTLNSIALKMFLDHPIFGVGLNNFIPNMEKYGQAVLNYRFLQPVHNVYLLVLAETGLFGLICLISLIWLITKDLWKKKLITYHLSLITILFLAFFDHYLFTLQQGLLLAALVLGLTSTAPTSSSPATTTARKTTRRTHSRSTIRRRKS